MLISNLLQTSEGLNSSITLGKMVTVGENGKAFGLINSSLTRNEKKGKIGEEKRKRKGKGELEESDQREPACEQEREGR